MRRSHTAESNNNNYTESMMGNLPVTATEKLTEEGSGMAQLKYRSDM